MTSAATIDDTKLEDGVIELGTKRAAQLGFIPERFKLGSYLWKDGDRIMISFIASKREGKGYLSALFKAIEDQGLRVAVPTPFARMESILRRKGFVMHREPTDIGEECEVWERPKAQPVFIEE